MGVLVPAVDELSYDLPPVRPLIVCTGEIKGTKWIVDGTDKKESLELTDACRDGVANRSSLHRREILPGSSACVAPSCTKRVREDQFGCCRHDYHLLDARVKYFLEESRNGVRAVSGAMGLSPPQAVWGKRDQVGLGDDRQANRSRKGVEHVIPAYASKIPSFRGSAPALADTFKEPVTIRLRQQSEHQIPSDVHVMRYHDQLTETWLSEIVGE